MTVLKLSAVAFWLGVGVHGIDHLIRGWSATPTPVWVAGFIQLVLVNVAVWLVLTDRPSGAAWAVGVGLVSATLFTAAHMAPTWWFLSDSFISPPHVGVTWYSWISAAAEIGTALVFAAAGAVALRSGRVRQAA
jgi:hypothetical protein